MTVPISALVGNLHVRVVDVYFSTWWACIEDDEGRRANVCIDGRDGSATRYRLFDQARRLSEDTAKLVELGSPEEDLVIGLLSRWYDSEDATDSLTDYGKKSLQEALLRLRLCDPDDYHPVTTPQTDIPQ